MVMLGVVVCGVVVVGGNVVVVVGGGVGCGVVVDCVLSVVVVA